MYIPLHTLSSTHNLCRAIAFSLAFPPPNTLFAEIKPSNRAHILFHLNSLKSTPCSSKSSIPSHNPPTPPQKSPGQTGVPSTAV